MFFLTFDSNGDGSGIGKLTLKCPLQFALVVISTLILPAGPFKLRRHSKYCSILNQPCFGHGLPQIAPAVMVSAPFLQQNLVALWG
jgi:hypothetical protein